MNDISNIDKSEFVIEPSPSGCGYYASLPKRTAMRSIGNTPDAAMTKLTQMLDPVNSVGAVMDRMPVVSASACQLLRELAEIN